MTMPARIIAAVALVVAMVAMVAPAAADPREEAEQFYRIGEKAYKKQNYREAAKNFDAAYKLVQLPDVAFAAAQAHRLQYYVDRKPEHVVRAVELYQAYVALVKDGGRVGDASTSLAELEAILRELKASAGGAAVITPEPVVEEPTSLVISVDPSDVEAKVTVDDVPVTALDSITVEPGEHEIKAAADGYVAASKKVRAVANRTLPIELELAPRPALITIDGPHSAQLAIDGRAAGKLPVRGLAVPAGRHLVSVTRRGRRPWTRDLELARAQTVDLDADLATTTQRKVAIWTFVGAGLATVGAVITGAVATKAGHDASAIDDRRRAGSITATERAEYDRLVGERDDYRSTAMILGGTAIVAATAAALLFYFDNPEAAAPVTPVVSADGGGIAVGGRF